MRKRIVAEVSKNWPEQAEGLLSHRFEEVIATNSSRGYELESWQFQRVMASNSLNETIIAVFVERLE